MLLSILTSRNWGRFNVAVLTNFFILMFPTNVTNWGRFDLGHLDLGTFLTCALLETRTQNYWVRAGDKFTSPMRARD